MELARYFTSLSSNSLHKDPMTSSRKGAARFRSSVREDRVATKGDGKWLTSTLTSWGRLTT